MILEGFFYNTIWFGAVLFYLADFGRNDFSFYTQPFFRRRNLWLACMVKTGLILAVLTAFILLVI